MPQSDEPASAPFPADAPGRRVRVGPDGPFLHVVEEGPEDGPLVLLLHGFPEFWYGWRRQIAHLAARGLRVAVPDQRGYGLSDRPRGVEAYALDRLAEDAVGLARALGRERFSVVGHDWGGVVAWWLALREPGRLERLAILNAPHPGVMARYARRRPTQALRSWYVLLFQLPALPEALLGARGHRLAERALLRTSRRGTFSPEDLARYREAWSRPGAWTAMLDWYRALRLAPRLPDPRVRVPTLLLWGDRDAFLEPGLAEAARDLCDDARLVRFGRATHWLQHEEPEAVSRHLGDFLLGGSSLR
jgi:pimeloyl-ACP methyl ester carboxylesterase